MAACCTFVAGLEACVGGVVSGDLDGGLVYHVFDVLRSSEGYHRRIGDGFLTAS